MEGLVKRTVARTTTTTKYISFPKNSSTKFISTVEKNKKNSDTKTCKFTFLALAVVSIEFQKYGFIYLSIKYNKVTQLRLTFLSKAQRK